MIQCYVVRASKDASHELLHLRRAAGDFMGGSWQSVYGRIEEGETAWQAAIRELREETGLAPLEFYQLDTVNMFYLAADDAIWLCPSFCAVVAADAQVVLNEEHDAHRWLPRSEFLQHIMWPGERRALDELYREILDDGPAKPHLLLRV
jgi:dATP pyrophosphohydrolase